MADPMKDLAEAAQEELAAELMPAFGEIGREAAEKARKAALEVAYAGKGPTAEMAEIQKAVEGSLGKIASTRHVMEQTERRAEAGEFKAAARAGGTPGGDTAGYDTTAKPLTVNAKCPSCGTINIIDSMYAGRVMACASCKAHFTAPDVSGAPADPEVVAATGGGLDVHDYTAKGTEPAFSAGTPATAAAVAAAAADDPRAARAHAEKLRQAREQGEKDAEVLRKDLAREAQREQKDSTADVRWANQQRRRLATEAERAQREAEKDARWVNEQRRRLATEAEKEQKEIQRTEKAAQQKTLSIAGGIRGGGLMGAATAASAGHPEMQAVAQAAQSGGGGIGGAIAGGMKAAGSAIGGAVGGPVGAAVGEAAADALIQAFVQLKNSAATAADMMAQLAGAEIVNQFKAIGGAMQPFVEALNPSVVQLFQFTMRDLNAVIGVALVGPFQVLIQAVRETANVLYPVTQRLAPIFTDLARASLDLLRPMLDMAGAMANAALPIIRMLADNLIALVPPFQAAFMAVTAVVNTFAQGFAKMFGEDATGSKAFAGAMQKLASSALLAAGMLAKLTGQDAFLKNLISAAKGDGAEKGNTWGMGAATGARHTSFGELGKSMAVGAFTAQGAGQQTKTTDDWLKKLAEDLEKIQKGSLTIGMGIEQLKSAITQGVTNVVQQMTKQVMVSILGSTASEAFTPEKQAAIKAAAVFGVLGAISPRIQRLFGGGEDDE